jgi:hypothetical protein
METQTASVAVVHSLKSWPEYFQAMVDGKKPFELRRNDRGFDVGHYLSLWEWCPEKMAFTGRSLSARVTFILRDTDGIYGLQHDYVVMGVEPIRVIRSQADGARPLQPEKWGDAQRIMSAPELQS